MPTVNPISASTVVASINVANEYLREANRAVPTPPIPVRLPEIDFSKDTIVIWVPGTNDHQIPVGFKEALEDFFLNGYSLAKADYLASWNLTVSITHGINTLEAVLDYIKAHKKPNAKVYLAGESQGSLVISRVLSKAKYYGLVTGAALLGAPGVAKNHFEKSDKVKEFNNRLDPVTIRWGGMNTEDMIGHVSRVMTGDILAGLNLIGIIFHNPLDVIWLALSNLHKIPIPPFKYFPSFHKYGDMAFRDAVSYLWAHSPI